ncbi:hypothetical protein [Methylobacterium sp. WL116]|uniref:DUF6894 family protein n=1 Tax=Methylobacterium sp. WL116 TaxID=2603889 RepID=UPI0011C9A437|nr:hypothetical protein [Methylobacterium sp. WL116]TXM91272.1 hypothetical protein FV223_15815 [Methylobacterium sp. WL116]
MPRFHFNIYDGEDYLDKDGFELPSWEQARHEAIRLAGEIFQHTAGKISLGEDWRMEVTDEKGLILFRLDFTVLDAAAVPSRML